MNPHIGARVREHTHVYVYVVTQPTIGVRGRVNMCIQLLTYIHKPASLLAASRGLCV